MSDIRKRVGQKGTTYQVRYPSKATKSGYAYETFNTLKEASAFLESGQVHKRAVPGNAQRQTVPDGIQKWLDICEFEGRDGKDPVSDATLEIYKSRARIMQAYSWDKMLHELETPDVVAFRSWLLKHYSRDQAKKVLSSFHSVLLEMVTQGVLATDPAVKISIQHSRYKTPVQIPSVEEASLILRTADQLANDKNQWIAKAWNRYRAMVYLAADTGMRPQEYLALPIHDLSVKLNKGTRSAIRFGYLVYNQILDFLILPHSEPSS